MTYKEKVKYAQIVTDQILSGSSLDDIKGFLLKEIKYERPILDVITKAKRNVTDQIGDHIQTMILSNENASTVSWGEYERLDPILLQEFIETAKSILVSKRNQEIEILVQEGNLTSAEIIEEISTTSFHSEDQITEFIEQATVKINDARNDLSWGYKGRVGKRALLGRFILLLGLCLTIFRLAVYFQSSPIGLTLIIVCGAPAIIYFSMLLAKRLQDAGISGLFILLPVVFVGRLPLLTLLGIIIIFVLPSTKGANRYG